MGIIQCVLLAVAWRSHIAPGGSWTQTQLAPLPWAQPVCTDIIAGFSLPICTPCSVSVLSLRAADSTRRMWLLTGSVICIVAMETLVTLEYEANGARGLPYGHRTCGLWTINVLWIRNEVQWPNLMYHTSICMAGLKKPRRSAAKIIDSEQRYEARTGVRWARSLFLPAAATVLK
jgi:hypothetical protein